MNIAKRLSGIRQKKGLTQQALADSVGVHVTQVKRYEAGYSQSGGSLKYEAERRSSKAKY
ncbi:MAG: helix-turn-helix transcriptional regulator [Gammaproteobacteria bacterium]|nr:helix-turn-helix transcriptional regulator [Gammaproteobacteria bacterium]